MSNADQVYPLHIKMARDHLEIVHGLAQKSRHLFLAYLVKLAMAELHDIENGRPTKL